MENNGAETERKGGNCSAAVRFAGYALLLVIAGVLGLAVSFTAWFYATCPVYTFDEPKPFHGEKFHNPYQSLEPDGWRKCNFHMHARPWKGLTSGVNTSEEVFAAYEKLNYDAAAMSNYMHIDTTKSADPLYIPIYEHGYNIRKVHQLALDTRKVLWRDYLFPQNLNQKQHIIDVLKTQSRFVAVNHPGRLNAYLPEDLKYLSGYDLIEVLNKRNTYEEEWDAALSNGHKVWLMANDDSHSVNDFREVQRSVTFVNVSAFTGEKILNRLVQGAAFGVLFPKNRSATLDDKIKEAGKVSFPIEIDVRENSLHVVWHERMTQIDFIGDSGSLLQTFTDTDTAFYSFRPEDSYVRVRLTSPTGFVYYLNPVIRYAGDEPVRQSLHIVDASRTFAKRALIMLMVSGTLVGCGIVYVRTKRKRCCTVKEFAKLLLFRFS